VIGVFALVPAARADTIKVTTYVDEFGPADLVQNGCSLREAVKTTALLIFGMVSHSLSVLAAR